MASFTNLQQEGDKLFHAKNMWKQQIYMKNALLKV